MAITPTGPCGSQIDRGTPIYNFAGKHPEVSIKFKVPPNQLCCFKRTVMGTWTCDPATAAPGFNTFVPCSVEGGVVVPNTMEPVSLSVKTPANAVGQSLGTLITNATQLFNVIYNPDACQYLDVVVKYRHVKRTATEPFFAPTPVTDPATPTVEVPVTVAFPAALEIFKQAGIDGRTTKEGIKWCTDGPSSSHPCCEGELPADARFFTPIQSDTITARITNIPCPQWDLLESYRGLTNDRVFLGQPIGGVLYNGYTVRERQDIYSNPIFDIDLQFLAKTVAAAPDYTTGTPPDEVVNPGEANALNGRVGFWGKAYCPKGRMYGDFTQHWLPVCEADGNTQFFQQANLRNLFLTV